jgi:hypothetical protein
VLVLVLVLGLGLLGEPSHLVHSLSATVYCMEFLESNIGWLKDKLLAYAKGWKF